MCVQMCGCLEEPRSEHVCGGGDGELGVQHIDSGELSTKRLQFALSDRLLITGTLTLPSIKLVD